MTTSTGRPSGNIRLGRHFTADELARIEAGTSIETIIQEAPRPLTREESYALLFGAAA